MRSRGYIYRSVVPGVGRYAVSELLPRLVGFVTMKYFLNGVGAAALACLTVAANARAVGYRSPAEFIVPYKRQALQDIVSVSWWWDNNQY